MMSVRFEGGEELARNLDKLSGRVSRSMLREALRFEIGEPLRARASSLAPRGPGSPDIADNIRVGNGRSDAKSVVLAVGPTVATRSDQPKKRFDAQGVFLELGTTDTKMQAFMRPAFDAVAVQRLRAFGAALWVMLASRGMNRSVSAPTQVSAGPRGGGLL